jgi:hypothetical protein
MEISTGDPQISQGQSLPSFGATGVDDPSPRLACHSLSKSMGTGALDSAGLKCSFHGFSCFISGYDFIGLCRTTVPHLLGGCSEGGLRPDTLPTFKKYNQIILMKFIFLSSQTFY